MRKITLDSAADDLSSLLLDDDSSLELCLRGDGDVCRLLHAIASSSPHIESLTLSKLALSSPSSAHALIALLRSPACSHLTSLTLHNTHACLLSEVLMAALDDDDDGSLLTSLSLSETPLTLDELALLMSLAAPHLRHLRLHRNQIDVAGTVLLAQALPACESLREIDFSGNFLGREGARELALALRRCSSPRIETLVLDHNQLGGGGSGEAFQELFKDPTAYADMVRLGLASNQLLPSAGGALSRLLSSGSSSLLRELDLSHNLLGDGGVQVLSKALPKARSLRVLNLSFNKLTTPGVSALAKSMQTSRLVSVDVSFNEFGNVGGLALLKAVRKPTCRVSRLMHHCNRMSGSVPVLLDRALYWQNCRGSILALRSANLVRRVGKRSPANQLPGDLCRMLAMMLM